MLLPLEVHQVLDVIIYGQLRERRLDELVPEVVERSLEANTLLEVEVIWLAVKILVPHEGLEVRNETSQTDDNVRALLHRQVVDFDFNSCVLGTLWVIRTLEGHVQREGRALVQIASGKEEEATLLHLISSIGDILGGEFLQPFVVHHRQQIWILWHHRWTCLLALDIAWLGKSSEILALVLVVHTSVVLLKLWVEIISVSDRHRGLT